MELDGHNLRDLNVPWVRKNIGYVGQMPTLFAGTVRSNILLGNPSATDEEVIQAAKAANAHDFILKLSGGYDSDIGNGGSLLQEDRDSGLVSVVAIGQYRLQKRY